MRKLLFTAILVITAVSCGLAGQVEKIEKLTELEGDYALTDRIDIHIRQEEDNWVFQIEDDDVNIIEPDGEARWSVPDLDIEFYGIRNEEGVKLNVSRYGETMSLTPEWDGSNENFDDMPVSEIVEQITPRLMVANHVPGVSVSVLENGELSWLGQYGIKTYGQPEAVTDQTIFEAASMSKPIYAYAVLQLVEEGVLDLDTPLVEYLEGPYIEGETLHKKITPRMVLSHTSGFPNWRNGGRQAGGPISVHFEPGSDFRYSGEGFYFLQQVVEKLTSVTTEEFMQSRLLRPLGMHSSSYIWQPAYDTLAAAGHNREGDIPERERRIYKTANAAFTLYTTPSDYARFLVEMIREDRSPNHSLSTEMLNQMLTVQSTAEGRKVLERRNNSSEGSVHFGLGWKIEDLPSGNRINHTGSNSTGFRCLSEFSPQTENGIIIMTNASGGSALRTDLMRYAGEE